MSSPQGGTPKPKDGQPPATASRLKGWYAVVGLVLLGAIIALIVWAVSSSKKKYWKCDTAKCSCTKESDADENYYETEEQCKEKCTGCPPPAPPAPPAAEPGTYTVASFGSAAGSETCLLHAATGNGYGPIEAWPGPCATHGTQGQWTLSAAEEGGEFFVVNAKNQGCLTEPLADERKDSGKTYVLEDWPAPCGGDASTWIVRDSNGQGGYTFQNKRSGQCIARGATGAAGVTCSNTNTCQPTQMTDCNDPAALWSLAAVSPSS